MSTEHEFEKMLEETLEGAREQNPPKDGLVNLLRIFSSFNKPQKRSPERESNLHQRKR